MITNVTTVLVGTGKTSMLNSAPAAQETNTPSEHAGKFVMEPIAYKEHGDGINKHSCIRIGIVTNKNAAVVDPATKQIKYVPIVKYAHTINNTAAVKLAISKYKPNTEDTVKITFNEDNGYDAKRILLRVTYKDMETRYRKWTETYEVVVAPNATKESIAKAFQDVLNKSYKRNRFSVSLAGNVLTLTANRYTDDDSVDTINVSKKVRFDVHMYYTLPNADGWATKNKYAYTDAEIVKTDGVEYAASAKLVRDREAWAMGYDGILNRGEGTWPIIKPEMNVDLNAHYDVLTIEFNNEYRAADDIVRSTRECIEIYEITGTMHDSYPWYNEFAVMFSEQSAINQNGVVSTSENE